MTEEKDFGQEERLKRMQDILDGKDAEVPPASGPAETVSAPAEASYLSARKQSEKSDELDELYRKDEEAEKRETDAAFAGEEGADAPEGSEGTLKEKLSNYMRWISVAAAFVVFVCLGVAAISYLDFRSENKKKPVEDESSEVLYQTAEFLGVVTKSKDTKVSVYNAETGEEKEFTLGSEAKLTDEYGTEIELTDIVPGNIVSVEYYKGTDQTLVFRYTSKRERHNEVTGLTFTSAEESGPASDPGESGQDRPAPGRTLTVDGKSYTYDDRLMLFYRGMLLAPEELDEYMVVNVNVLDGHIYTMDVLAGSADIWINSVPEDYLGTDLVLTPELGSEQRIPVTEGLRQIRSTEGVTKYRLEDKAGDILAEGELFVSATQKNKNLITLLPPVKHYGTVVFHFNVRTAVAEINGVKYENDKEIRLPYGDYTVKVSATGYKTSDIQLTVNQPYFRKDVKMNAVRSNLVLSSSYLGVKVTIEGVQEIVLAGNQPKISLEPGTYRIVAELPEYEALIYTVEIKANEADQLVVFTNFKKIIPPEPESSEPEPEESPEESGEEEGEEPAEEESPELE